VQRKKERSLQSAQP